MAIESDVNGFPVPLNIDMVADAAQRIKDELHRVIVGKDELIETLFSCLLAEGHILVEGNPGLAKTTITKLFGRTLGCTFNRQQFTPDLLPGDITGSYVFDQKTGEFYARNMRDHTVRHAVHGSCAARYSARRLRARLFERKIAA